MNHNWLPSPVENRRVARRKMYKLRSRMQLVFRMAMMTFVIGAFCIYTIYPSKMDHVETTSPIIKFNDITGGKRSLSDVPAIDTSLCSDVSVNIGQRLIDLKDAVSLLNDHERNESLRTGEKFCEKDVTDYSSYPIPVVDPCAPGGWLVYVLGLVYTFIGLAVVCDEYFVPALEVIAEKLDLSDDVAGATLMAAGGSAPELFTTLMGTFVSRSNVGFGTVVGSAVFNILFVIGMCAVFSKEVLTLTWWPLARDSSFYTFALVILAIVYGVSSENSIELWESLLLLSLYALYVLLMRNNKRVHTFIARIVTPGQAEVAPITEPKAHHYHEHHHHDKHGRRNSADAKYRARAASIGDAQYGFNRHSKFRAGVLHIMYNSYNEDELLERARVHIVAEIQGDVETTFKAIDLDGDGYIDGKELGIMLSKLLHEPAEPDALDRALKQITENNDGRISLQEFSQWYMTSQERVLADIRNHFDQMDKDQDGKLNRQELEAVIQKIHGDLPSDNTMDEVISEFELEEEFGKNDGHITFKQFEDWYQKSMLWQQAVEKLKDQDLDNGVAFAMEEDDNEPFELEWPDNNRGRIFFLLTLPIVIPLYFTIPDVRREHLRKFYFVTWMFAILWIGIFSYFMVWWAMILGDTINMDPAIMGLTFLAAGTSIPDLLTSIIVARQGLGDMAVSSSIGSNIFDILIGLPLPWLLFSLYYGKSNQVTGNNLLKSVLILVAMLLCAIFTIAMNGWKMTKKLGMAFFFLYVVFVVQDLLDMGNC